MRDLLPTFLIACAAALAAILGRFGYQVKSDPPPADAEALRAWRRRWLWTLAGEAATVPALGIGWGSAALNWSLSVPLTVGGAMVCGALGFGFWLDAVQRIVTRKLDNV
jgi:hypothetical protein